MKRNSIFLNLVLSILSFTFLVTNSFGQSASATWALTANGNVAITGNVTGTSVAKGVGYHGISSLSYTANGVSSTNWVTYSYLSFDITSTYYNQDYYQYTVSPTAGSDFTVTDINLQVSASTSTPSWFVYYSLDGFATYTLLGGVDDVSFTGLNILVPDGSTMTLRVFGMDLVSSGTAFRNKNVIISGTTSGGCTVPSQPASIGGTASVCANTTGLTYSVTNDPSATSYTWTLPSGWSGTSSTNSISGVQSGTSGGNITVVANNGCGSSTSQTLPVTVKQATTSTLNITACNSYTLNSQTYNSSNTYVQNLTNQAGCDSTLTLNLTITNSTLSQPTAINGTASVCESTTGLTYSVTNDASATSYTWTLPSGWSGTSSTNSISGVQSGTSGGNITVVANNVCGSSTIQTLPVIVKQATTSTLNITACNSYTLNSQTYNSSNTYVQNLTNQAGCDSTLTLNLTITNSSPSQPTAINGTVSVCESTPGLTYSVTNDPNVTSYTWTLPSGWSGTSTTNSISVQSGISGGNVTVVANNPCGTSTVQTLPVIVKQATTSTLNITTCSSQFTSPSGNYLWTTNGMFMDTISNMAGCDSVITVNLTLNSIDNSVTQNGNTLTANTSGSSTYQWLNCDNNYSIVSGANSQSFTPTSNGNYAVQVTDNSCLDTSLCFLIIINSAGITANTLKNQVQLFPNPTNGNITATFQVDGDKTIQIYSASGSLIWTKSTDSNNILIDFNSVESGIYFVHISTESGNTIEKVVKE